MIRLSDLTRRRLARCGALAWISLVLVRTQATTDATSALPADRLSLADARRLAFQRNWDLLAAKSDVDIALAQRIVAREFPNPTASFSVAKISVDGHASRSISGNGY